jgi:calcineurin-like phosphoesterase family protein
MTFRFISDLHIGHENVLRFDQRPFENMFQMENVIIDNWNKNVKKHDRTYILGDTIWSPKFKDWKEFLDKLNGQKVLIVGNHDAKDQTLAKLKKENVILDYKYMDVITVGNKKVILSHSPQPFYFKQYSPNVVHLYGHVHLTPDYDYMKEIIKHQEERFSESISKMHCYNVGCMCPEIDYTPRTIDEIIENYSK